ncbi:WYL domain-containing protein [Acidiphilium sp. C61]|uniref:WYL domain-containing protein n=1 Tax=Acidiphilium sp. C61 TaxID=1671485 RepID=UPI00157B7563|nr:WYL domain-containing protein [Acidiphilium sp. C61]
MSEEKADLRWGVERRLEFIEFRLFWEGHVNRSDLIEAFGISVQQASTDLNRYQGLAAANMLYDKSAKAYVRGTTFNPLFLKPDASRYLSQLRSVAERILDKSDAWIGEFPDYATAPAPARAVTAATLRSVVAAIRRSEAIEIKYQSLSRPEPRWRWIAPHAIGFDGFRWHARAFCEVDLSFKDFVLSRIIETRATRASDHRPENDEDWQAHVVLQIGPHPDLSETQKKVIGLDYGMHAGHAEIRVRRAFLYYTLKRLGLDTDPSARRPQDQQIVLLNQDMPELAAMLHREEA